MKKKEANVPGQEKGQASGVKKKRAVKPAKVKKAPR